VLDTDARPWGDIAARLLEGRPWAHRTRRVRALGWDFGVRTNVAGLGERLDRVFEAMATGGEPAHWYSFVVSQRPGFQRQRVYRDGVRLLDTPDASRAFLYMLWDINQHVFRSTDDKVLVHASVVEHGGRGVVLSAPSESGKTTLALGLVERGLGYLTDEAAAIHPATGLVHPFPKALSVDTGAQSFLDRYRPEDTGIEAFLQGQWQVPPSSIRPDAVATAPVRPAWVIVPAYAGGGAAVTRLAPLSRGAALTQLMEQSLNLHVHGRVGFDTLAAAVRSSRCFRLVMGDLPSACDTMERMLDEGPIDG